MIDQNTKNICRLITQTLARVGRIMSLSQLQGLELALAFTFLRRIDSLIGKYAKKSFSFYSKNKEKLSDEQLDKALREISDGHSFYNVSGYTFKGLLNSNLSVDVAFNTYMQGFNSDIQYMFSDLDFEKNVAILQRKSKYLVDLFEYFSELDLSESAFNNKRFIDIITTLVSDISKKGEIIPTPMELSKLICECLFCDEVCQDLVYDEPSNDISIYDPVCGTGSLLAYAGERARIITGSRENIYLIGKEISSVHSAIANFLVLFSGNEYSFAKNANTLTEDEQDDLEYKFIVGDLPSGLSWAPIRGRVENENIKETGRFSKGLPSTNDSQFLFIQDIVSKMDCMGGRAAFITSDYVLQGGSVESGESRIRTWLFESGLVETVIALPAGTLSPNTKTPVFLWILSCSEPILGNKYLEKMEGKVRLIDTTRLVPTGEKFKFDDKFVNAVVREYKSLENTQATRIVKKEDFGFYELDIWEGNKEAETVRISLDTDINTFVEEERKPYAKGKITIGYNSVEKGYSVDFRKFFKPEDVTIPSLKEDSEGILQVLDIIGSLESDILALSKANADGQNSNWKELPLRSATEIAKNNSRSHVVDMRGLPIITIASLRGEKIDSERHTVTHNSKCVSSKDVIFVKSGANSGEIFKGVDGLLAPTLAAVRCFDESIILPEFLYYLLKGYERSLRLLAKGTAVKSLSAGALLDFKCLIPPVEEQRKITHCLDKIISKIDNILNNINSSNNIFSQYRQTLIENVVRGNIKLV